MDHILYQIFEIIFEKTQRKTVNSSMRRYVNKIENKITFKIKTGSYLKFLTPKTMKLLKSSQKRYLKTKMVKTMLIQKLLKQYYQFIVIFSIMIISAIKSLVYICSKQIIWSIVKYLTYKFFKKPLIQSLLILKHRLLIKILNCQRQMIK